MTVSNGQKANETTFNNAFLSRLSNTSTVGVLGLLKPSGSGATVSDLQLTINALISGAASDDSRLDDLEAKFDETTGHKHTGAVGDAPPVDAVDIANVPLLAFLSKSAVQSGIASFSQAVTTELSGYDPSSDSTEPGVPVDTDHNIVILRHSGDDRDGRPFYDTVGNEVYGRITESVGVWTCTFFSSVDGVETAYSFETSTDWVFYYQVLVNPLGMPPVYQRTIEMILNATAGTSSSGGGGSGGGFRWESNDDPVAIPAPVRNLGGWRLADFDLGDGASIVVKCQIPADFVSGTQLFIKDMMFCSSLTSGNAKFAASTILLRPGVGVVGETSGVLSWGSSVPVAVALSGTANTMTAIGDIDVTNSSGQIGGEDPDPLDWIVVVLTRTTPASDAAGIVSVLLDTGRLSS